VDEGERRRGFGVYDSFGSLAEPSNNFTNLYADAAGAKRLSPNGVARAVRERSFCDD